VRSLNTRGWAVDAFLWSAGTSAAPSGNNTGAVTARRRSLFLIAHLKETRIRIDVVCPQQLHHRRHLVGPIVFAIREHISELAKFIVPECGAPGCGVYVAPVGLWVIPLGETSN
jgi:hypothetical protein